MSRKEYFESEDGVQISLEIVMLLPLLLFLVLITYNMFASMRTEANVTEEVRNAARQVASYGGNCGQYRPQKLINTSGFCGAGTSTNLRGGQSVSDKVNQNLIDDAFFQINRLIPAKDGKGLKAPGKFGRKSGAANTQTYGIQCTTGNRAVATQTRVSPRRVGDTVNCSMQWSYVPVGIPPAWWSLVGTPHIVKVSAASEVGDL